MENVITIDNADIERLQQAMAFADILSATDSEIVKPASIQETSRLIYALINSVVKNATNRKA